MKLRMGSLGLKFPRSRSASPIKQEGAEDVIQFLGLTFANSDVLEYTMTIGGNAILGAISGIPAGPPGMLAGALVGTARGIGISAASAATKAVVKTVGDALSEDKAPPKGKNLDSSRTTIAENDAKQPSNEHFKDLKESSSSAKPLQKPVSDEHEGISVKQEPHESVAEAAKFFSKEQKALEDSHGSLKTFQNDSSEVVSNIDKLNDSVGKKLNPKVKDLAENVKQFDEVASKDLQAGREYMFGQFGLDENGMPLGGLPKREDLLVGGQVLSVTESEKDDIEGIQDGIKEQVSVLNSVADGLDMVGYDLKGVGSFATAIEQLTLASKLGGTAGFDSTKAYVAGISSLFQGIGANIGGGVGAALSSMGSMAATGASIGSAIPGVGTVAGAVIGGAVGLISSIFGGDDEEEREEAEREKMRQQIYQGMLSRSLSGAGPYSLKMLRESSWDYDKLKKRFGNKDEEELIKYQNRLELLDDIGASLEKIGSPEIVRSIDTVRAKYEYAAKSVKGMLDIASAEMTEISALVFGLTADNLVTMFDSAIETAEDASHAGRLIAEALELQIVDSFKKMAISQAVNDAVMPMLQPILNELVSGALSGGLSPGEMADLVLQAQEIAASVAPAVSALYGAFDEAGVLNYTYSSTPFETRGNVNGPVITSGTGIASGQKNDTQGDNRPVQVVVQVGNHEFETMVTELADNVFVRAERRKGVVNAQKVFG